MIIGVISSLEQLNILSDYLDGIVVETPEFSCYYNSQIDITPIINKAKEYNKKIFIKMDIMPDEKLLNSALEFALKYPRSFNFLVSDLGLFTALKENNYNNIFYVASSLITNYEDLSFYLNNGFKGCMPSLEIPLNDVIQMQKHTKRGIFFKAFGFHLMMHSKRNLITTFQEHKHQKLELRTKKGLLKEELREGFFPIIENSHGTIIFRQNPVNYLENYQDIQKFSYLFFDNIFIEEKIYNEVIKIYYQVLNSQISKEEGLSLFNKLNVPYENTFLDTDTVYLKEEF